MKHEPIVAPRVHPLGCRCARCAPRIAAIDRILAWLVASALLFALAVLIRV